MRRREESQTRSTPTCEGEGWLTPRTDTCGIQILSEFDTIADHVLVNLLGVPSTRGHEQGKRKADRSKLTQVNKLVYTLNDFPYYVEPGIEHGVVWSTGKLREKDMLALLDEKLSGRERIYFINPPSLQSVAEVEHAHVFSRDASTDSKTEP